MTDCFAQQSFSFHPNRCVVATFDAPQISSDGGALLLRPLDDRLGLSAMLAALVPDERAPERVLHPRLEQLRQRLYQMALGYEDCNDADSLRHDPVLKTVCDRLPKDEEGLSSQPTLSRFENAVDMKAIKSMLLALEASYVESLSPDRELIVLDIDTTDDETHGRQQLTFFHGFYDQHMYHPQLVFDEDGNLITAILRPGNTHAARGSMGVLNRIIRAIRKRCPHAEIMVRADSGFAVPRLYRLLEQLDRELSNVDYIIGLAKNPVLLDRAASWMNRAKRRCEKTESRARCYGQFLYAAKTWRRRRRVIVKAEHSLLGQNPRFVVTSFTAKELPTEDVYRTYCARGQCENFIKDLKNAIKADRLSCSKFAANCFRLLMHAAAYRLMFALRDELATERIDMGNCQLDTLRLRLLKVGAMVSQSVRRVLVRLPSVFPLADAFCAIAARLTPKLDTS
jgi:hypothetical protein